MPKEQFYKKSEQVMLSEVLSFGKKYFFPDKRSVSIQFETIKDKKTIANINDTQLTAQDVFLKLSMVDDSKLPKDCDKNDIIMRITQINKDMEAFQSKFGEFDSIKVRSFIYDAKGNQVGFQIDSKVGFSKEGFDLKQQEAMEIGEPIFKKMFQLSEEINPTLNKELNYEVNMNRALKKITDLNSSVYSSVSALPTIYLFIIYLVNFVKKETLRKTSEKPLSDTSSFFRKQQTDSAKSSPSKDHLNVDEAPPAYSKEVPKGHVRVDEDPPPAYSQLKI